MYNGIVRFFLEYESVVWQPLYLVKDQLQFECIQNTFLNFIVFEINIFH